MQSRGTATTGPAALGCFSQRRARRCEASGRLAARTARGTHVQCTSDRPLHLTRMSTPSSFTSSSSSSSSKSSSKDADDEEADDEEAEEAAGFDQGIEDVRNLRQQRRAGAGTSSSSAGGFARGNGKGFGAGFGSVSGAGANGKSKSKDKEEEKKEGEKEAAGDADAEDAEDDRDDDEKAEAEAEAEDDDDEFGAEAAKSLMEMLGDEPMPKNTRFTRIPAGVASRASNDPFDRLYLGAFGPHGPEVLRLVRGRWGDELGEGEDCVTAVKLTGDANVPAGAASFRAKVGKSDKLDSSFSYPEELGVMARYKGQGRVAKPGFKERHWVDGELLLLDGRGGSLTGGAELGFVWAVPGERRLLILFSSLQLPDASPPVGMYI
mmetsp:Transcript_17519/g.43257  ORF Transcript_17519/g.43257 Transcript_17519/m.43257 type:complete len:379 (+) Transcript_17519:88-1224(+)